MCTKTTTIRLYRIWSKRSRIFSCSTIRFFGFGFTYVYIYYLVSARKSSVFSLFYLFIITIKILLFTVLFLFPIFIYRSQNAALIFASNFWAKLTSVRFDPICTVALAFFFLNIWHEICRNLKLKGLAEIPCQNGKGDWKNHRCHSWPKVPQGHPKLLKLRRNTVPLKVLTPKYTEYRVFKTQQHI